MVEGVMVEGTSHGESLRTQRHRQKEGSNVIRPGSTQVDEPDTQVSIDAPHEAGAQLPNADFPLTVSS